MKLEFKPITLDVKPIIDSYTKECGLECSDLSFANLFIWGVGGKMEYAELDDVLYIKLNFPPVPTYLWAPIPKCNKTVDYKKAIDIAFAYLKEIDVEPTLRSVWMPFTEKIKEVHPELYVMPTEIAWDYVDDKDALVELKGKKYHGKRNHINKFLSKHADYEYKRLDQSMIEDCLALYEIWSDEKDEEAASGLEDEKQSVRLALENREALGLVGGCIYVDGKLMAFTLGERLLPYMQLIHIEKADTSIDGLYPLINQQYLIHECEGVTLVNREEDMGIEGMRKAKRSYHPIKMIEKYLFSTRDLTGVKGIWME